MIENQVDTLKFADSTATLLFVFAIDFSDPFTIGPVASGGKAINSVVVRIEPEDVLFTSSVAELWTARKTFAEALARQTALLAVEKDFPAGVEPSLSAKQIEQIPAEIENRVPDLCVNRSDVWLV
jgi:hypothetical protein